MTIKTAKISSHWPLTEMQLNSSEVASQKVHRRVAGPHLSSHPNPISWLCDEGRSTSLSEPDIICPKLWLVCVRHLTQ